MNYAGERRIDVAQSLGYKDGSTVIKILKHLKARIAEDASIEAYAESFDRMARGHVKCQALTPMADNIAEQMMRMERLDGIGPARSADGALLDLINKHGTIKALDGSVLSH